MKKIWCGLSVLILLNLTGCATLTAGDNTPGGSQAKLPPATVAPKSLTTNEINQAMSSDDQAKLTTLVSTSPPQYSTSWKSGSNTYSFTSFVIFVNDKGQPCRDYQVTGSIKDFITHSQKQMQATACRLDDMQWHVIRSKDLDKS